jgi:hypothetical protein
MRTRLTLLPGVRGAKQLPEQYVEQLVCVRYRYDEQLQKRYKTVELIVKEYDWTPDEKRNLSGGGRTGGTGAEPAASDLGRDGNGAGV